MLEVLTMLGFLAAMHIGGLAFSFFAYRDRYGKFDFKVWFKAAAGSFFQWTKCVFGAPRPQPFAEASDAEFLEVSTAEAIAAHNAACDWMLANGYTASDYLPRNNDCDDYAMLKCAMVRHFLKRLFPHLRADGAAVPVFIVGYARSGSSPGHTFVKILIHGQATYWNSYAEEKYRAPMELPPEKLARMNLEYR